VSRLDELKTKFIVAPRDVSLPRNTPKKGQPRKYQVLKSLGDLSECGTDLTVPVGTLALIKKALRAEYERGLRDGQRAGDAPTEKK